MALHKKKLPPLTHVPGTVKGEEMATKRGREPGRNVDGKDYRDARDSTGIGSDHRQPIDPNMPNIPPA